MSLYPYSKDPKINDEINAFFKSRESWWPVVVFIISLFVVAYLVIGPESPCYYTTWISARGVLKEDVICY